MRVKKEHLDKVVSNPFNFTTISLRVLGENMYGHFAKHYPQFFEEEPCSCGNCHLDYCECDCHLIQSPVKTKKK